MANGIAEDDIIRERELFRYFQPLIQGEDVVKPFPRQFLDGSVEEAMVSRAVESPDKTLTALAQLCACRLDASRAMISVIGKELQHFIAEATRTVNLRDTTLSDDVNDGLWVGCTTVNKEGRLCEKTVELPPTSDETYPCFQVTDLSADERFNTLPFVTGSPHFRFYAGTCLTTKRGINIGSLFIVDDRVRPELTASQIDFLGTVAGIVMTNMELNQEAEERNRSLRMSGALSAFQTGRGAIEDTNFGERTFTKNDAKSRKRRANAASFSIQGGSVSMGAGGVYAYKDTDARPSSSSSTRSWTDSDAPHVGESLKTASFSGIPSQQGGQTSCSTFVRAASLLRQSLDLQDTGGVVFLDSRISFGGRDQESPPSPKVENRQSINSRDTVSPTSNNFGQRSFGRKSKKASEIIGFSTAEVDLGSQTTMAGITSFSPVDQVTLQSLLQNYPRGKLWCFDDEGILSAWDEDVLVGDAYVSSGESSLMRHKRKQTEATLLSQSFPGVRQLLFAPLWDSSAGRWFSGCFCFSTSPRKVYSIEIELSFLSTFCNTVMAEASRVAVMAAERKKGDFISSISHELRSPLHGILASAEFLAEEDSDPFQNSLVDTITSCGRTLLDTVNHILDYSKINTYEKNLNNATKSRVQKSSMIIKSKAAVAQLTNEEAPQAPPLMNVYATVDVAAVAEEVIEGVYAGQIYQDISSTDIAFMSSETKSKISERGSATERRGLGESTRRTSAKEVEVILDICRGDFTFTTQPGALRRIIMNLFGNSLKYTDKGVIVVSLSLSDLNNDDGPNSEDKLLEIIIKDTGKGISSDYLRSNLFTPFSQEDTLATGVGLGLSIVNSIIKMLNGSIEIRSQLGEGTEVFVRIPLMRFPGTATAESTPSTVTSSGSLSTCMQGLQSDHCGKTAILYGSHDEQDPYAPNRERMRVLHTYVTEWFGLRAVSRSDTIDLIIVDEKDLPELQETQLRRYPTVVLCGASPLRRKDQSQKGQIMEFVSKPFGPYKLAKAVYTCLEKVKGNIDSEVSSTMTFPDESPMGSTSDADTIVMGVGALNMNAQISSRSSITENHSTSGRDEFPFPPGTPSPSTASPGSKRGDARDRIGMMPDLVRQDSRRPKLTQRSTEPFMKFSFPASTATSSAVTKSGEVATSVTAEATAEIAAPIVALHSESRPEPVDLKKLTTPSSDNVTRPPRLLLVDDNKINLRLLETFMKKRKYKLVDSAENGQLAVSAAEANKEGYDIIFMDISMPIMNGFEATRAIREIEVARNAISGTPGKEGRTENRALIIALTGLASSRDQTEAFNSGVDLFLTKPVSFKEVGRILDNWEAHGCGGGEGGNEAPKVEKKVQQNSE